MKEQDRIWLLMARKLSGEATPEELAELARFQQEHPDMTYSLQVLSDLWTSQHKETAKEEAGTEDAFQRHLTRMALRDATQPGTQETVQETTQERRHSTSLDLFFNYFKIARRSIYRNRGFSAINISGLAIGLASAIVLLLWIRNELTYDQFHKNRDRVYQVLSRGFFDDHIDVDGKTSVLLGPYLQKAYHREVDTVVRMNWSGAFIFSAGDKHIQTQGCLSDPGFFRLFTFPLLHGDPATALQSPRGMILTEKLADRKSVV